MVFSYTKDERTLDILHYKTAIRLKKILQIPNHQNIIIYGVHQSGKTKLIQTVFKELFGPLKEIEVNGLIFKENLNYYIFDLSVLSLKKHTLFELLKDIVNKYDHYNKTKIIIFENYNNVPGNIQKSLKSIMETAYNTTKFVLITNTFGTMDRSLLNNCCIVRVPLPTEYDKYIYIKGLLKKDNINVNEFLLLKDCSLYNLNHLMNIYFINYDVNNKGIYNDIINQIIDILITNFSIIKIREVSLRIKCLNINIPKLFHLLIDSIMKQVADSHVIYMIIKEISSYEYIIKKSYRDIISIESFLIRIYKIFNEKLL